MIIGPAVGSIMASTIAHHIAKVSGLREPGDPRADERRHSARSRPVEFCPDRIRPR